MTQAGKAISEIEAQQRKQLQEQLQAASTQQDKAQAQQAIKDMNIQEYKSGP